MRISVCSAMLMVMMVILCSTPAMSREGLYIGGSFSLTNISHQADSGDNFDKEYFESLKTGPGIWLRAGWGLNDYFAVEGSLTRSYHKTDFLGLANLERQVFDGQSIMLKISVPVDFMRKHHINLPQPLGGIEPYLLIGGGHYQIGDSGGTYYKGLGIDYGIGLDLYLTSVISINAGLTGGTITFTSGKFRGDRNVVVYMTVFDLGIAYHF